ncbi:MAG TPA: DUF2804 family protein [Solirubrobacteraceae bacterium]
MRLPLLRGGRPLKRWRYVGVFCEELMACAALVRVGPASQVFWAVYTREDGRLRERTRTLLRRGATVGLAPGRMSVRDRDVGLELVLHEDGGIQTRCAHHGDARGARDPGRKTRPGARAYGLGAGAAALGAGEVWTRKQAGVRAHGTLTLGDGSPRSIEAAAVIDDTVGYHPRETEWWWSAGVGTGEDGAALAWNLVAGVNDPPAGSERAVWVDGLPSETAPVRFAADLSEIVAEGAASIDDGLQLHFTAEAVRVRHENLVLLSSDYTAPFGAFSGTLPGGVRLASGLGVIEHHRARW